LAAIAALFSLSLAKVEATSTFTDLHDFAGNTADGGNPAAEPILVGTTLYGTTTSGGSSGLGTIYSYDTLAENYQLQHSFVNTDDSSAPTGLVQGSGGLLYGFATGDYNDTGELFTFNTSTNNTEPPPSDLIRLSPLPGYDETGVNGTPLLVGSTIYGTSTGNAGSNVFSFALNSLDDVNQLYNFGNNRASQNFDGPLVASGSVIYGLAPWGSNNAGVIFSINTASNNAYSELHDFTTSDNPSTPNAGGLILSGNVLYGLMGKELFSYNLTTSTYSLLKTFAGTSPTETLTISNNVLYGIAGTATSTEAFAYKLSNNTTTQYVFDPSQSPIGGVQISNSVLYGVMSSGGADGDGELYSLSLPLSGSSPPLPEPTAGVIGLGSCAILLKRRRLSARVTI